MQFHKTVLRVANGIYNCILLALLVVVGAYSFYALWDNSRIYAAAGDVQADMIRLKPVVTQEAQEEGADFSELLAVNGDVCAWVTLDNTQIDYPVLQGETNFTYINTDVYGEFALAGSIFVDSRNSRDFTDTFSLLYGHHMADHKMFGDLDLYKEQEFFTENRTGQLILPDATYDLDILACLLVSSGESHIFQPTSWRHDNIADLLTWVRSENLYLHDDVMTELENATEPFRLLCLSTCSYEFTDARTILIAVMRPYTSATTGGNTE